MARDPYTITLDDLGIWERTRTVLMRAECKTVADILLLGRARLQKVRGCGPRTIFDVTRAVSDFGYGGNAKTERRKRRQARRKAEEAKAALVSSAKAVPESSAVTSPSDAEKA